MGACVALTLACSGVAAAETSAATVAVGQACVVNANPRVGSLMTVTGTGFTPGDSINLQSPAGKGLGSAIADATGAISAQVTSPVLPTKNPAAAVFTLTASDALNPLPMAPTTIFHVANLGVAANPKRALPSKRVTWSFSGFTSNAEIYAHYLHGKTVTATKRFGRATGPCGILKERTFFYPGKARYKRYEVQFDNSRRYAPNSTPRVTSLLKTNLRP